MNDPNRVELNNGSYLLFDFSGGEYRVAIYERKVSKSASILEALSRALGQPIYHKRVKEIAAYVKSVDKFDRQLV